MVGPRVRGALVTAILLAVLGCDQVATQTTFLDPFLFPERIPEAVPFPAPSGRTGVVTGFVKDANGNPIAGVKVSNGSVFTYTGNGVDATTFDMGLKADGKPRQNSASEPIVRNKLTPAKGQFVLAGLPLPESGLGSVTLSFTFDEVLVTRQAEVRTATFSADIPASASVMVEGARQPVLVPFGIPALQGDITLPLALPVQSGGAEAARVSLYVPESLACVVEGKSEPTFPVTGSRVAFGLRNLPGGKAAIINGIRVEVKTLDSQLVVQTTQPVDSVLLDNAEVSRSSALAQVTADLAIKELGREGNPSLVIAQVSFQKNDGSALLGADGQPLVRNIPIRIVRTPETIPVATP
jgi:hypothetical protein